MKKLVTKFAMDMFPSVLATVIGAYIVQHYIRPQYPGTTAAAVAPAEPARKATRTDSKPVEKSADIANIPETGVRAKGISEKAISDKSGAEKAAEKEKKEKEEKASDKVDKSSETASIPPTTPADTRRHQPGPREKATAKTVPAAPAAEPPVVAVPAPMPEPDANDLARAAIERLRGSERKQETARAPEPARVVVAPATPAPPAAAAPSAQSPSIQPLPPPIVVSTPSADSRPAPAADDPSRPTPPADIPNPRPPLDLRADAVDAPAKERTSVADDVLSAAKNMFHSVLPK